MIDLGGAAPERYRAIYRNTNVTKTRAALRNSVTVRACGREASISSPLSIATPMNAMASKPTHSLAELDDLMSRLPDRMLIYLAELDGEPLAGLFVMTMNERVAAVSTSAISTSRRMERQSGAVRPCDRRPGSARSVPRSRSDEHERRNAESGCYLLQGRHRRQGPMPRPVDLVGDGSVD